VTRAKPTKPQRDGLRDVASCGYVQPKGLASGGAASRVTGTLCRMGLIELIPGARWKLTDAGTAALSECKSCETRRRAGFDGLCPACAGERTRSEGK
jgi:hypothetical protein